MTAEDTTRRAVLGMLTLAAGMSVMAAPSAKARTGPSADDRASTRKPKKIGIVLFDGFETLDVFGPVQMWGRLPDYEIAIVTESGGPAMSAQGVGTQANHAFADAPQFEILMIPGGEGARTEVRNQALLDFLRRQDRGSEWTTSVCTGSAVLAKAGILNGRRATTNKRAWDWATGQSTDVAWQPHARWVIDGKYATSSGVSAGTDMALGLVERIYDRTRAENIAREAEYVWNASAQNDPFAVNLDGLPPSGDATK